MFYPARSLLCRGFCALLPATVTIALASAIALQVVYGQSQSGQNPATTPQPTLPGDPNEVSTQQMRVPPTFLYEGSAGGDETIDPFSSPEGQRQAKTTQEILSKSLGVDFPPGTYAHYDPRTGALAVRHHPAVIKAVNLYIESLSGNAEKQVLIRIEIYQVPLNETLRLQRLSESSADNTKLWDQVQRAAGDPNDPIEAVTSISTHARSGQRAKAENQSEFIYPTETDWSKENEAIIPAAFETRNVGTILEVDPVIGADDVTIDINIALEHHTAPPTMHPITIASPDRGTELTTVEMPEFHCKRITTSITTYDGTTQLIGAWQPTGKPEYENSKVMHVAFLRTVIQVIGAVTPSEVEEAGSK